MSEAQASGRLEEATPVPANLRPNPFVLLFGSAAIALLSFAFLPWRLAIPSTLLGALMVAGAEVDARTFLLPDTTTLGALAAGVALAPLTSGQELWSGFSDAALRAAGATLILLLLRAAHQKLRGQEGLGLGDVKLGAAIGAWLPLELAALCFALASIAALAFVAVRGRKRAIEANMRLPFGAFLCPALWMIFFINALPS
jgi:leader peptidase (prepilin peptidase)/N-methyltransferase